ncbi:aspartic peptidase domain-containing protein [Mycena crocata]|nr:aspartic peptidase domain-containing protein [Mycena crocata]
MWYFYIPLLVLSAFTVPSTKAVVLHGKRLALSEVHRRAISGSHPISTHADGTLYNVEGIRYVSNITINGQNMSVILDTGSSDLVIQPPRELVFNDTGIPIKNQYGGGDIEGTIGYAAVEFRGYTVKQQAFLNATSVGVAEITELGLDGLIGLAFDGKGVSTISAKLNDSAEGKPFLFNVFDQTPQEDNFIGLSLSRTDDLEGSADASFTINEIDDAYSGIWYAPKIPVVQAVPGNHNLTWSIPIDGIAVDGVDIALPKSTVATSPSGKIVVLMDSGTPGAQLPAQILHLLYSAIPGVNFSTSGDDSIIIPCNTTSIVTVQIGGQPFPIHPLDISEMATDPDTNITVCVAPMNSAPGNRVYDGIFGDVFLRNMYTVYNFGNSVAGSPTGNATMQLLSQTNATTAAADVLHFRMSHLSQGSSDPPAPGASKLNMAADSMPTASGDPDSRLSFNSQALGSSDLAAEADSVLSDSDTNAAKYGPIIVGMLSGNLLLLLILVAMGTALCVKRGGKTMNRVYAPVHFAEDEGKPLHGHEGKRYSDA